MKLNENYTFLKRIKLIFYDNLSLSILVLPYLLLSSLDDEIGIKLDLFLMIPVLILLDIIFVKFNRFFKIISYTFVVYFFYSYLVYTDSYYYIQGFSFRYFSLIFIILTFIILYQFKTEKSKNFLNFVIFTFSFLIFLNINTSSLKSSIESKLEGFSQKKISFLDDSINKNFPIILIVCDELASSSEIFNLTESYADYDFDNSLKSKSYFLKEKFYSHTKSTKISMASMLNFNIQNNTYIKDQEEKTDNFRTTSKLKNLIKFNSLTDSLNKYNIKSFSYGLINFPRGEKPKEKTNHLWGALSFEPFVVFFKNENFLSDFLYKSVLNFIDKRIALENNFFDNSRKETLDKLEKIHFKNNSFYYFHFYAPHDPFSYFDEFVENKNITRIENHINYRRFVLNKLLKKLNLEKFKETKVIIVGDHGYRGNEEINPLNTFGAFYGFEKTNLDLITSPQDIAHLILHNFK